jgi:Tol biopolymer transport system component/DNA-binding winged helix-turn-helix (wHTH) protein
MSAPSGHNPIVRFGTFQIDVHEGELRRAGVRRKLGPQPFQVLLAMLERPGEVVTREELRRRLWPDNTFIDYELALKKCVNRIREVLSDSVDSPRFIETVRGRGYRFIAPVEWMDGLSVDTGPPPQPAQHLPNHRKIWQLGLVCLLVVAACILLLRRQYVYGSGEKMRPALEPVVLPLVGLPGEQSMPAFSPDGSRVAFLWRRPQPNEAGIYVVVVGSQSVLRLSQGTNDYSPAWSPDGREVAFLRDEGDKFFVEVVPALGGTEKSIYTGAHGPLGDATENVGLSFSPDGKLLAFAEWNPTTQAAAIKLLSLGDSSTRFLTSPPPGFHDRRPAFSPAGERIAFVRSAGPSYVDEMFVVSVVDGRLKQLTADGKRIFGSPTWARSGGEIVYSSNRAGLAAIWRIAASGGTPQPVLGAGPVARYPNVSPSGGRLAYEHVEEQQNLWRLKLQDPTHAQGSPSILVSAAKTYNFVPQFSPDGRKIAFQTERSGYSEVWICNADGSNLAPATGLQGFAGTPRWSPDSRYLAFDYRPRNHSEIHVLEVAGGHSHSVATFPDADNMIPSWSRNGEWIYFGSNHGSKGTQIWKVALKDGATVQVTNHGGLAAFESVDGRRLFYTKLAEPGIWTVPVDGGSESAVWPGPGPDHWSNWAVTKNGIYFLAPEGASPPEIQFLDLTTKRISHIARLEKPSFYGLTVSPDNSSLIYSQWDRFEHDIVVMNNFR